MKCLIVFILFSVIASITGRNVPDEPKFRFGFPEGRVVGGHEADEHSAPWIVSLQLVFLTARHNCGGSIIATDWIVTAAHCLVNISPITRLEAVAGVHDVTKNELSQQRRAANRRWTHPAYAGGVAPYDIGLIQVEIPFAINNVIRTIALPTQGSIPIGSARLNGWGSVSLTSSPIYPDKLQTVQKPIITNQVCGDVLGPSPLHSTNLCTGPLTGGTSACSGDSGGPLDQHNELIGIVSWGVIPCGTIGKPSVYVRVSAFVTWINEIRNRN